ncbi:hypothetical protein T484DRAFT_1817141 [Baffinella frigidus]|nr:hypothetical protein T484DRAFT_1817141 [Cryptophyta sp. CCMP2293]
METSSKAPAAEHFVARAWENLHVVICPSSPEELDSIAANFPGVARHMFVEWFHPWSEQATLSVAIAHLADLPSSTTLEVENVATYLAGGHRLMVTKVPDLQAATGRRSLSGPSVVGPSIFAVFAGTFQSILARREKELRERADRMQSALGQLRAAGNTVADMKAGLSDQNAQLSQAQLALGAMLLDISSVTTQVEKQKATVVVLKNRVAEKVQENLSIRDEVDREEASAAGAWADAVAIITALPRRDVDKLKRNKNPPAATKMVFDVLLILMDRPIRPVEVLDGRTYRDTFTESLALISDIDFPDMLLEYTQEMMTLETAELIAPYLEHRDFSPAKIGALLGPAGEVTAWILVGRIRFGNIREISS